MVVSHLSFPLYHSHSAPLFSSSHIPSQREDPSFGLGCVRIGYEIDICIFWFLLSTLPRGTSVYHYFPVTEPHTPKEGDQCHSVFSWSNQSPRTQSPSQGDSQNWQKQALEAVLYHHMLLWRCWMGEVFPGKVHKRPDNCHSCVC